MIFPSFPIHHFRIHCGAMDTIEMTDYPGFSLKDNFYDAAVACLPETFDPDRKELMHLDELCTLLFHAPVPDDNPRKRIMKNDPRHPYCIDALYVPKVMPPGSIFCFEIVLMGKACSNITEFITIIENMGNVGLGMKNESTDKRGKYKILTIESLDAENNAVLIYGAGTRFNKVKPFTIEYQSNIKSDNNVQSVSLNFSTPLQIIVDKHVKSGDFSFPGLMKWLSSRLADLVNIYGDIPYSDIESIIPKDFEDLKIKENLKSRMYYYHSGEGLKKFRGCTGSITITGNIQPCLPLLWFGQWLHLGRQTAFGWGRYSITVH